MKTRYLSTCVGLVICALSGFGCVADGSELDSDDVASVEEPIQGGQLETGYPAVGLVATAGGSCTGTLIAPSYVLTAAHCAGTGMVFKTGTSAANFVSHTVDQQITHPTRDLLIAHLASPISGVPLIQFNGGALPAVNEVCKAVGFGWYDVNGATTSGTKRSATEQVDSATSSQIVVHMGSGIADHGDSGGPLLCKQRITAVVYNHTDGLWPQHTVENYTTIDAAWIASTIGHATQFGAYQTWRNSSFFGANGTLLSDINADGRADLVNLNSGSVSAITSTGSTFGASSTWWSSAFFGANGTLLGDVTGDGRADLVGLGSGYIGEISSTGSAFGTYQTWWNDTFAGTYGTFIGDINGDGRSDAVGLGNGYVGAILSTGSAFSAYQTWLASSFNGAHGTLLGDVDGDGRADLVSLNAASITVRRSTGVGFGVAQTWWSNAFYGTYGTLIGDIDGDGRADLVGLGDGYIGAILSTGGAFGTYQTWWNDTFAGSHGTFLGDINGDGRADLVGAGDGYVGALLATP